MKKRYKCQFCNYETNERSRIHIHHIKPKEVGGTNKKSNLVYLCPNHHNKIYSEYSKHGIHTLKDEQSIIITGWYFSSVGYILGYIDNSGQQKYIGI